jgi:hypothetical protein
MARQARPRTPRSRRTLGSPSPACGTGCMPRMSRTAHEELGQLRQAADCRGSRMNAGARGVTGTGSSSGLASPTHTLGPTSLNREIRRRTGLPHPGRGRSRVLLHQHAPDEQPLALLAGCASGPADIHPVLSSPSAASEEPFHDVLVGRAGTPCDLPVCARPSSGLRPVEGSQGSGRPEGRPAGRGSQCHPGSRPSARR